MPKAQVGELELDYEITGEGEPLLLLQGLGVQRVGWPQGFLDALASAGFQGIAFDYRDLGESSWLDRLGRHSRARFLTRATLGLPVRADYTLKDLAVDAVGLLEHLGHTRAHVLGVSMGGMVAQRMAIHRPGRVHTLTSVMSSPHLQGYPGWLRARAAVALRSPPSTREEAEDAAVRLMRIIGSPGFPFDEEGIRARTGAAWERGSNPDGFLRQLAALLADGDRAPALNHVSAPTLVIHGTADPLVPPEAGAATARAIPGAQMKWIAGMGHDLPEGAWPIIVQALTDHVHKHT